MMVSNEVYYYMYDEPELLKELLKLITNVYLRAINDLRPTLNDIDGEYLYHWFSVYKVGWSFAMIHQYLFQMRCIKIFRFLMSKK